MAEALAILNQFQGAFQLGVFASVLWLCFQVRALNERVRDLEKFVYPSKAAPRC